MGLFQYSTSAIRDFISETSESLRVAATGNDAVVLIEGALRRYTVFDLQRIGGAIRLEVEKLPEPYRSRYRPYSGDLLTQYYEFLSDVRKKKPIPPTHYKILDSELWDEFWSRAKDSCFLEQTSENYPDIGLDNPAGKFFYRLVYGYAMLIAGKPGHPVGMPFPGGWKVKEEDGVILCPIRDKEKDLPQALCNYCPAKQDDV